MYIYIYNMLYCIYIYKRSEKMTCWIGHFVLLRNLLRIIFLLRESSTSNGFDYC